jgi:pimeloyl-ACP methyl ester carboxylesterase
MENNKVRGVIIPGLAMNASEIPIYSGMVALQNPEIGSGIEFENGYVLEDVARHHVETIEKLNVDANRPFWVLGMSMGGMIAGVMASQLRGRLPKATRFGILVSSPNSKETPAVPLAVLKEWLKAKPGVYDDFKKILVTFFSDSFLAGSPEVVEKWVRYRVANGQGQTPIAFLRQLQALRIFAGERYFAGAHPSEMIFVDGDEDKILGQIHREGFRKIVPEAKFVTIRRLGHMVNLEAPFVFNPDHEIYHPENGKGKTCQNESPADKG